MVQQGLFQAQVLRQEQIFAPQQIQSLKILTLPLLDLQTRVNQEMEANPTLERLANEGEQLIGDPVEELASPESPNGDGKGQDAERDEFLQNLIQMEDSFNNYPPPGNATSYGGSDIDEKRQYFFDSLTTEPTLHDNLLEQLRTGEADEDSRRIGEIIIGSIDDSGYLRSSLDELIVDCQADIGNVRDCLKLIQTFDPPGVGGHDLRECLLLQLGRRNKKGTLAYKVVDKYLEQISKNRIPEVAKALRVSPTMLYKATQEIRALQPRPGLAVRSDTDQYVLPEVFIEEGADGYDIRTNRDHIPRLRVSPLYRKLLENKDTSREVREYIKEKIVGGNALIKSIEQRQSTIHRIAEIVVKRQNGFFDDGQESMKPLTMSQVAEEIGVHETTVSRAIANKYIQTPRGLFPFKHFFTTGYRTSDGDMLSSLSIKSKIQTLVSEEDPGHPLSDQQIVDVLRDQGLKVARRTVAKYREELGIQASHLRKSYGI